MSDIALEEHVSSAKSLSTAEKETALYFNGGTEGVKISTYQRGMITGLMKNQMAEIEEIVLEGDDGDFRTILPEEYEEDMDNICGVFARIPMGSLTIKNTERSSNAPSSIISTSTVDDDTFN